MKIIIVMPAYNAARTLAPTMKDIPPGFADEIILVDDASNDNTFEIAQRLGLTTVKHEANKGYGANQKTCYRLALAHGADIVVMIHPDYQYDSRLAPYMTGLLQASHLTSYSARVSGQGAKHLKAECRGINTLPTGS